MDSINVNRQFSLYLTSLYNFEKTSFYGVSIVLASLKEDVNLVALRKHKKIIEYQMNLPCVFYFKEITSYKMDKLIEEEIAFVLENKCIFLPFMAIIISKQRSKENKEIKRIMPLTQKFILEAIYNDWNTIGVTQAANKLGVSNMSMTRLFDELEFIEKKLVIKQGRSRSFYWVGTKKELWNLVIDYLHNPVVKEISLSKELKAKYSAFSALSYYSFINEDYIPVISMFKQEYNKQKDKLNNLIVENEEQTKVKLQIMEYDINFHSLNYVDPLSVILTLDEIDKNDPRVESVIDDIWKGLENGRWNQ